MCYLTYSADKEIAMPSMKQLDVSLLHLDLDNFRTVHQKNECHAINTMIAISPDWFWALMVSLLEDGYHATENILVLESEGKYVVKEGNRRIAALKIIFDKVKGIEVPELIRSQIKDISKDWKKENATVPCSIYKPSEAKSVEKIISLIHAKGEKAGRDHWTTVARARYSRDYQGQPEAGLDLLEKYLQHGKNFSEVQAERWSGDYPLSVLDEAVQKLFPHIGFESVAKLLAAYPKKQKGVIDGLVFDIGMKSLGFKKIRDKNKFFGNQYGVKDVTKTTSTSEQGSSASTDKNTKDSPTQNASGGGSSSKPKAQASNDPRAINRKLKNFHPRGYGREKLVTLLNEIRKLKIDVHPHAFCFLLRSMFELSAKAYCEDCKSSDGPSLKKNNGNDKALADLLQDITKHMTHNNGDTEKVKLLHGATAEIAKKDGLLSVTSLNQLVHNQSFSILSGDICILFSNIFPLLDEMNK